MIKRSYPRLFPLALILLLAASAVHAQAQESLPAVVKRVKPAVVAIATYDASGEALMTGSGFFLRPGQVVTNLHVVRGAVRAEIKTLDGKGRVFPVNGSLAIDEEGDLALLSVDTPTERSTELASELPDEGEPIFVIGNPLKLEGSVSDGIVSAVREVPNSYRIIQITAPISHGNSGSPVFNMKGQVLGVVTVKVTNGQNINLALAAARVAELKAGKLQPLSADLGAKEQRRRRGIGVPIGTGFAVAGQLRQRGWLLRERCEQKSEAGGSVGAGRLLQSETRKEPGSHSRLPPGATAQAHRCGDSQQAGRRLLLPRDGCVKLLSRTQRRRGCVRTGRKLSTTSR